MENGEKAKLMRRIHRFLREEATVDLAWMPDASGSFSGDTNHIMVNPFFECIRILIHEALHGVEPKMTEREVRQKERQLVRALSDRQILYLVQEYLLKQDGEQIPFKRTRFRPNSH